jgi:ubiquinone/menaquinone biosynthesis C-methylase UbiE
MGVNNSRVKLVKEAEGKVLELGVGTGANLPFYQYSQIDELILLDRSKSNHLELTNDKVSFVKSDVTNLPFEDNSFDTVVFTLLFCSVDDVSKGLLEVKRVLNPNGKIIFIEHVLPEKKGYKRAFKILNPIWKTFSQGCQLTKDFKQSLKMNGFNIKKENKFGKTVFISGIATVNNQIV